jgi:hypothetical protein
MRATGHREGRRTSKLLPKDTLSPRPIPARKVPTLKHERRDNPVEPTPSIPKPMLHRRQLAEILRRARHLCVVQLEHDAPAWRRVYVDVELAHMASIQCKSLTWKGVRRRWVSCVE